MTHPGVQFLVDFYSPSTEGPIFVCSLPNERGGTPGEQRLASRDPAKIAAHAAKWDRAGRAFYFAVNPLREGEVTRSKANVGELAGAWCDTDLKDMPEGTTIETLISAAKGLRLPPSAINNSGHGIHCFWFFKEGLEPDLETVDRLELVLRQLADVMAGDMAVCEVARLMRLPGTHNTKGGGSIEVKIVEARQELRYELRDLEEWLYEQPPLLRKASKKTDAPIGQEEQNPFLAAFAKLGFKPIVDVEARLRDMRFEGSDREAIHNTQRTVTASLLLRRQPYEEIVSLTLEATKLAPGVIVDRWNWRREERGIREMCDSWIKKNPSIKRDAEPRASIQNNDPPLDFGAAKAAAQPKKTAPVVSDKTPTHVILARTIIQALQDIGEPLLLEIDQEDARQLWRCSQGVWHRCASLDFEIENAARAMNIHTTNKIRSETTNAIKANPDLGIIKGKWDQHGLIPCRDGLVDWRSGTVRPYRPDDYATWQLNVSFERGAGCPVWETALGDFFQDKDDASSFIQLIKEFAGAMFLSRRPRALSHALVLYGPSNSGKSQIVDVLGGMFPTVIAQPLSALDGPHGTVPFAKHAPWILHEAFTQGKWVFSDIIKQLITHEPVQINIKYGAQFEHAFMAPVLWATNFQPNVKDGTKAVANRMHIVPCGAKFDDKNQVGAQITAAGAGFEKISSYVLAREASGVLNWALDGLRACVERGRFDPPPAVLGEAKELFEASNLVAEFLREHVKFDVDRMIRRQDFNAAFAVWWGEERGEESRSTPSAKRVAHALKALGDGRIGIETLSFRDEFNRYFGGIVLTDSGMDFWRSALLQNNAKGMHARISKSDLDVHKVIPEDWFDRRPVISMRLAFKDAESAVMTQNQDRRRYVSEDIVKDAKF